MKRKVLEYDSFSENSFDESVTSGSIYEPSCDSDSDNSEPCQNVFLPKRTRKRKISNPDIFHRASLDDVDTLAISDDESSDQSERSTSNYQSESGLLHYEQTKSRLSYDDSSKNKFEDPLDYNPYMFHRASLDDVDTLDISNDKSADKLERSTLTYQSESGLLDYDQTKSRLFFDDSSKNKFEDPLDYNNNDNSFTNFEELTEKEILEIFPTRNKISSFKESDNFSVDSSQFQINFSHSELVSDILNDNSNDFNFQSFHESKLKPNSYFNEEPDTLRDESFDNNGLKLLDGSRLETIGFENPSNSYELSEECCSPEKELASHSIPDSKHHNKSQSIKSKGNKPKVNQLNQSEIIDPIAKKIFLDSSNESLDIPINLKGVGKVLKNKKNEILLTSKDGVKKNTCYYCIMKKIKNGDPRIKVHFANLVDHYEAFHSEEKHIKNLDKIDKVATVKGKDRPMQQQKRIEILEYLKNKGNYVNNLHANDVSEYVVARRPTAVGATVANYGTCFKCLKQLSLTSIHKHVRNCTGFSFKKRHVVKSLSKAVMGNYHHEASEEAIKIISHVREDDILDEIRYDDVAWIWLNAEASKYEKARHNHAKVRANLRRLGRLLQLMKIYNDEVNELADIFHENNYDDFILAVKSMGKLDPVTKEMKAPATANDMFHLIQSVTSIYDVMLGEKNNDKRLIVQAFQRKMKRLWHSSVGNTIAEQQAQNQRNKTFKEPSQEDLVRLRKYLISEIVIIAKALKSEYSDENYETLRDLLGCYLQLTNVRRAGEVERFRMSEFTKIVIRDKDCRVEVRGKRTKPVPIVFGLDIHQYLILLVKNRLKAKISTNNPFVFAQIHDVNNDFNFVDLCPAMANFAELCGADEPETLRGTSFRKQIATDRLRKGISEKGVQNLSSFMGHTPRIHCQNYQQAIFERDVATSKIVQESQTNKPLQPRVASDNFEANNNEDDLVPEAEEASDYFPKNLEDSDLDYEEDNENIPGESFEYAQNPEVPQKSGKKLPWKQHSIDALLVKFPHCLELSHSVPSAAEIRKFLKQTNDPILKIRKEPQVRSWIHLKRKEKRNNNDVPQRNSIPNYIYAAFKSYIEAGKEPSPKTCGKFIAQSPSRANVTINNIQNWVKLAIKRRSI